MLSGNPVRECASQYRGESKGEGEGHHHQGEREGGVIGEPKDEPSPGYLLHAYGQKRKEGSQHQPPEIGQLKRLKSRMRFPAERRIQLFVGMFRLSIRRRGYL
jgi:hypothetical protein